MNGDTKSDDAGNGHIMMLTMRKIKVLAGIRMIGLVTVTLAGAIT